MPAKQSSQRPRKTSAKSRSQQRRLLDVQPTSLSTAPAALPLVDWNAEADLAVGDALSRQRYQEAQESRLFKSLSREPRSEIANPAKVFSNMPHKRGDTQQFDDGERIFWLGTVEVGKERWDCYYTNRPQTALPIHRDALVRTCKRYKNSAGAHLFEDLKPGYLKNP